MPFSATRLHETLAAVCPIIGVDVPTPGTSVGCVIHFDPSATAQQQANAQTALAAFDWSQNTQDAYDAQQQSRQIGRSNAVRLQADVSNSTVNYADCTGLGFQLAANAHYAFEFTGAYTAAASTTGLQLALNGPAQSFFAAAFEVHETATTRRSACASAYDSGVNGTASAGATLMPFSIRGNVSTTAAGLLVVRFRSEVAASAVTIKRGSFGLLFGVG